MLLALALAGGNIHGSLPGVAATAPASYATHHPGEPAHHGQQDETDKAGQCCCQCAVGCPSAFIASGTTGVAPADYATAIRYGGLTALLHGRVLLPEPEPPRPSALT